MMNLGWKSLNDRRYCRRLLHFYKIQTNLTPAYLKDPLPPVKNHQYGTRSEHVLQEIKCNTDIYRGSSTLIAFVAGTVLGTHYVTLPTSNYLKLGYLQLIEQYLKVFLESTNLLASKGSFNCVYVLARFWSIK